MVRRFDAIVENGLLKPLEAVNLPERQRLRVTIESAEQAGEDRAAKLSRLWRLLDSMQIQLTAPLPRRAELYGRRFVNVPMRES